MERPLLAVEWETGKSAHSTTIRSPSGQCIEYQVADFAGGVAHLAGRLALHLRAGDMHDGAHHPLGSLGLAELVEQHAHGVDGGDGVDLARAGVLGGTAAHRLEHAHATRFRIDVATRGDPHATLDDAAQVGDDVAEHVGGDNHVVELRILDDPHAAGVDVVVVDFRRQDSRRRLH